MLQILSPYSKKISSKILDIARPLIYTNISRVLMGIVDMMMVGRISKEAIAAVGFSEAIQWIFIASIGISTMIASQAIISRRYGQKNYNECVDAMYCGQAISFFIGIPIAMIGYIYCDKMLSVIVDDQYILELAVQYSQIIFIGIYFTISSFAFRAFFTGVQKTRIYFKVIIVTNIVNAYLNLGLIFGTDMISDYFVSHNISIIGGLWKIYHFEPMGIEGAAIGTVIASGLGMLLYMGYLFHSSLRARFSYYPPRINLSMLRRHFELLAPISITEASHLIGWTLMLKIVGTLGSVPLVAMQITNRVNHASFMPAVGVGQACSTLVGYYLGRKKISVIGIVLRDSYRITFMIMGSIGICFILFAPSIISMFSNERSVIDTATPLLRFCGFLTIGEAVGIVLFSALEGAGDTKFVGFVGLTEMWLVFIPLCYLFVIVIGVGIWGAFYAWAVQLVYVILASCIRFYSGKWKEISI